MMFGFGEIAFCAYIEKEVNNNIATAATLTTILSFFKSIFECTEVFFCCVLIDGGRRNNHDFYFQKIKSGL